MERGLMKRVQPQQISIDGARAEAGLLWRRPGDWSGEVYSLHHLRSAIVMVWGPTVLLGRALFVSVEIGPDESAVSRFVGNGPLYSLTHKKVEALMALLSEANSGETYVPGS